MGKPFVILIKPFSTNLSNIPPVSMAMMKLISCSKIQSFHFNIVWYAITRITTSSLALILIHSPLRLRSCRVRLPIILAPSSSGLSLKSSLRHLVTISKSSARLLDSFWLPNLPPNFRICSTFSQCR